MLEGENPIDSHYIFAAFSLAKSHAEMQSPAPTNHSCPWMQLPASSSPDAERATPNKGDWGAQEKGHQCNKNIRSSSSFR